MEYLRQGKLEVYCGPMFSSKTRSLVARVDPLRWTHGHEFIFIKPDVDKRQEKTRGDPLDYAKWNYVKTREPLQVLELVKPEHTLVAIDEIQFFPDTIIPVLEKMLAQSRNIVVAGFDLDFKGDPFGIMPYLLAIADRVTKLTAVCTECGNPATRTQRLIHGEPADYNSPLVMIEGDAQYEPRCLQHHYVPGKPGI